MTVTGVVCYTQDCVVFLAVIVTFVLALASVSSIEALSPQSSASGSRHELYIY